MKIAPLLILLIAITILSCKKKFNHKINDSGTIPNNCLNCLYADSISGVYRGLATGQYPPNNSDSLTVTIEHIFLNLGGTLDSTRMFFRTTQQYDGSSSIYADTISMSYSTNIGFSLSTSKSGYHTDISVYNDTLFYHNWAYYWQTGFTFQYLNFQGKKL